MSKLPSSKLTGTTNVCNGSKADLSRGCHQGVESGPKPKPRLSCTIITASNKRRGTPSSRLQTEGKAQANIVDAGILSAEQSAVAHVHPASLDRHTVSDARADTKFWLE
jgi:hypothetical protein